MHACSSSFYHCFSFDGTHTVHPYRYPKHRTDLVYPLLFFSTADLPTSFSSFLFFIPSIPSLSPFLYSDIHYSRASLFDRWLSRPPLPSAAIQKASLALPKLGVYLQPQHASTKGSKYTRRVGSIICVGSSPWHGPSLPRRPTLRLNCDDHDRNGSTDASDDE